MAEPRVTSARITKKPKNIFEPMPKVYVTLDNGHEVFLFEYYPDELSFTESEFIGLTFEQAQRLKYTKDVAYLKS